MQPTLKVGLVLGAIVEVWTFIVLVLGWHKDPVMLMMFYLVILFQAGVLWWGLKMTAAQGKTYGGQVIAGTVMSAYGAVIVLVGSYILTSMVFPSYFMEVEEAGRSMMTAQGMSAEQIETQLAAMRPMQNSLMNSITGAVATVITGLVLSLIFGAFLKAKPASPPAQNA